MSKVSFLIPAKNERTNIARIIAAVRSQVLPIGFEKEIIICSNGSNDRTTEHVKSFPGIKVIDIIQGNKPKAINLLAEHATGTHLVFLDADVIPDNRATLNLLNALNDKTIILAGARQEILAKNAHQEITRKAYPYIRGKFFGISGGMYALRKEDFHSLPEDIVNEDAYLSVRVGKEHIALPGNAIFYHYPPKSLIHLFNRSRRISFGVKQLKKMGYDYSSFIEKAPLKRYFKVPPRLLIRGLPSLLVKKAGELTGKLSRKPPRW